MWSSVYEMDYFPGSEEKRTQQLTARVPKSIKDGIEELSGFWTQLARAKTGDSDFEITPSDVVVRLLQLGIKNAWAEVGGKPTSKTAWQKHIEEVLAKEE